MPYIEPSPANKIAEFNNRFPSQQLEAFIFHEYDIYVIGFAIR